MAYDQERPTRRPWLSFPWGGLLALSIVTALGACKQENRFAAPPPPKVGVARPVQQKVTPYFESTGNTESVAQIDLVARVKGFLSSIDYQDGSYVKQGTQLFVIEQAPYQAQLQQAQAQLVVAKAQLVQSQAEFERQKTLLRQDVTAQSTYDQALAKRDSDQGNVTNAEAGVTTAAINLGYTNVAAPFDGIATRHLQSVGALVGTNGDTKLATLVQLNPIYATFNVSEQDVLRIRGSLKRKITPSDFGKIPVEIGLMNEDGYPHKGVIQYISPELDSQTGTLLVRGIFQNDDRQLLPGFFVRVRVPLTEEPAMALLVPDKILGTSQEGRYVLVVNGQDEVEQRAVKLGAVVGDLRVIESGLKPEDRVVVTGVARAIPGHKVAVTDTTVAAANQGSAPAAN
ncbi:MAG: efflux RND transporter periplasmic adaptor subunit [Acetobacteraceae bacterium]|nr:efflux RND transporter periplasmic adaptor subunit [Acetobacteraceae bacterium]MBV8574598.1 efflux RND transporter periplasmic adaptor subunit [Acetobacteraceae bacterium]